MSQRGGRYGLVLCEGTDDCAVFGKIANAAGAEDLVFKDLGGKNKLTARLQQVRSSPDFTRGAIGRLLITRDADEPWEAAWQSLREATKMVFDVEVIEPSTWAMLDNDCELALWIAPGGRKEGMIETLCLKALNEGTSNRFACLDQFAGCLHEQEGGTLHEKEKFAIWSLIAQEKEQPRQRLSLSRAIKNIPIDWKHPVFDELSGLLQQANRKSP